MIIRGGPKCIRCFTYTLSPNLSRNISCNVRQISLRSWFKHDSSGTISLISHLYSTPRPHSNNKNNATISTDDSTNDSDDDVSNNGVSSVMEDVIPGGNLAIVSACITGLLTGIIVVLFNIVVHDIREFSWGGIAYRGASWIREKPLKEIWARVILVPASGGLIVSILTIIRTFLEKLIQEPNNKILSPSIAYTLEPILKTISACVTLGTGNSLGPEGPSVEIGASVAKGVGFLFDKNSQRKLSLRAAGSAAGIASGFNAAVAGCFFAVESVLWPSPSESSSSSMTNTTSMVILSAVIASVVSEIGLGSDPAFTIPEYDFRSPSEIPLYLLLGIMCGLVSITLSNCTSFMMEQVSGIQKDLNVPKAVFPVLGGFSVGVIALAYPEILYWGFENVDILLESRPFVKGLSVELLLQLLVVKIFATSLCRASGLVGGYYAPSLFIGAATGMAYGKIVGFVISQSNPIFHLSILEVASPQAYGLVGMAATLAGVCQVPLTAVLLLFELTQDYRIVLPLLGAVGMSSWIISGQTRKRNLVDNKKETSNSDSEGSLCELESSLCLDNDSRDNEFSKQIIVSQAMRIKYVKVLMNTLLTEAIFLMLEEKQSCAIIVDDRGLYVGMLKIDDIQVFSKGSSLQGVIVSEVCGRKREKKCEISPNMSLDSAEKLMDRFGLNEVAVILDNTKYPVGVLDRECIRLACMLLFLSSTVETELELESS